MENILFNYYEKFIEEYKRKIAWLQEKNYLSIIKICYVNKIFYIRIIDLTNNINCFYEIFELSEDTQGEKEAEFLIKYLCMHFINQYDILLPTFKPIKNYDFDSNFPIEKKYDDVFDYYEKACIHTIQNYILEYEDTTFTSMLQVYYLSGRPDYANYIQELAIEKIPGNQKKKIY